VSWDPFANSFDVHGIPFFAFLIFFDRFFYIRSEIADILMKNR
jgi:hypothetical protein